MCGFSGVFQSGNGDLVSVVTGMNDALTHRGPDDRGVWVDENAGLALGHRRLAIVDLSEAGHQPMHSSCGRFVIAFNGEIYNHAELRHKLDSEGVSPQAWRGHSDTEVFLTGLASWGVEKTLQASVGMFAFALWDRQEQVLTLARDRIGEKPLYYGWQGDTLLLGSELKAIKAFPRFTGEVDRGALTLLLRHNCIPAPYSIYKGIAKLEPGHYVILALNNLAAAKVAVPRAYWRLNDAVASGIANPFQGTPEEATDLLEAQLLSSIGQQMLADVPVGAFLSGGVDSSTIVALMQAKSTQPVRTFTIGFYEGGYDEATHAKAVAQYLGTQHTELYARPEDALAMIARLPSMYCEPFSDSSQIATFLVSQLAGKQLKVVLSGDGGDELFGGYNRYLGARKVWSKMQQLPPFARQLSAGLLRSLSPSSWDTLFRISKPLLPKHLHLSTPGDKAHKLADILRLADGHEFYLQLNSHWADPASVVIDGEEPKTIFTDPSRWPQTDSFEHWMMAMDAQTYMSDDIMVKLDRATMAASIEGRVPLLDHRIVELAWRMPLDLKIRNGQGKWLLREVLYRHVPKELIERPKQGFGIPLDSWLRGPLREWAEELLSEDRLHREGYFYPEPIRRKWEEHLSGKKNWQHHLWDILMFQAWLAEQ
ncbi:MULTISPECIES: asparagine synthase (glutamine-hydrolyzing) [Pseudomonas]|jgi:asparagine synthase (glutamine-hydrolysing)|uniref:asparagine synthase (glutamine-hydrolyzing) n=1 Tax=Pseudomonas rhodesiae TaxID=76760 RepID=A0A8I1JFM9_9PSED|nr:MULTISPECIES: asparagine synthase (glutamine-hydrolyzing) [Pseudomonas]MBI6605756.1 asparagine synthase (glutamine-hydrolyzing) [Pseudomonas sp. S4_EA_1b]MBI6627963.1 asparagine synthase (glutamine-hydrolyzing) [Pseudomonas rhodesiae]NMY80849.1 asparagine synthase (glutamine-hydrolyzing) [Pseudomonas rhodesiae]NMZ15983.1 asparagine synthase (glutamine-hydrolyzing) [Pseudomonas rhodesiae]